MSVGIVGIFPARFDGALIGGRGSRAVVDAAGAVAVTHAAGAVGDTAGAGAAPHAARQAALSSLHRITGVALALLLAVAPAAWSRPIRTEVRAVQVRSSGEYRYGEGWGATEEAAKEAARHDLVTRIRALVTSTMDHHVSETDTELTQLFQLSSRVLTVMQLDGLDYLELPRRDDRHHYLAFITESSLQAAMDRQRQRIRSMVDQAQEAVDAGSPARLHDALRLSYWAYLLAHTVDSVAVELGGVRLTDPRQALLEHMTGMVGRVRFQSDPATYAHGVIGVPLRATYAGRPVTLDLCLYTGAGMDFPHVAAGRGYLELHWDPAAITARRQTLQVQLLYAYEGQMRHFPEIQALHEVLGQHELNTYVRVPVVFPFVAAAQDSVVPGDAPSLPIGAVTAPASTVPSAFSPGPFITTPPAPDLETPLPIRILAAQTETPALLEALQVYARNQRLVYYAQRPGMDPTTTGTPPTGAPSIPSRLYVAVVTAERVLGVFLVEDAGYLEVRRRERLICLRRPEFDGAHTIWLAPVQP